MAKPVPHSAQCAARHRNRGPPRRVGAGGRGTGRDYRRGEPAFAAGRGAAGHGAVRTDAERAAAAAGAARGAAAADLGLHRPAGWAGQPQGQRRGHAEPHRGQRLRLALADLADQQVHRAQPRYRGAAQRDGGRARSQPARHRLRHPLWPWQMAGRDGRADRRHALPAGLRASGGKAARRRRRTWSTCRSSRTRPRC